MSIINRQTFWLKRRLKKSISENKEVELIIDLIFGKLEQAVLDNEQSFKSWEMLGEIEEDQAYENFTNLLIKMFNQTGNYCGQCQIYIEYFYKEILIFFRKWTKMI